MNLGQSWDLEFEEYHLSLVSAAPFAMVIEELRRLGYPMRAIAERTGVSRFELTQIVCGHRRRIRRDTARKLCAMLPEMLA